MVRKYITLFYACSKATLLYTLDSGELFAATEGRFGFLQVDIF
jgi:hypothetical protein